MGSITHGGTLPDSSQKADFYALIDSATIASIDNSNIAAAADIASTKLLDFKTPTDEAMLVGNGTTWTKITNGSYFTINFTIDGGGSAIETGTKGAIVVPVACTVLSWTMLSDTSCTATMDVNRSTYANYDTTVSIVGASSVPTISAAVKGQDTAITDWTSDDIVAGDVLEFDVDSNDNATRLTLALTCKRV